LYALNQEDFLKAVVGSEEYYKVCKAMYICGTPFETTAGFEDKLESNFKKARELLAEAKYDGTPFVLMHSTDLQVLTNLAPVAKSLMERAGFKVDMQSMDWQTLVTRRTKKEPADKGGWNVFHTYSVAADVLNPISDSYMAANGAKAWVGWPDYPEMEKLRDQYAKETDPAKGKALAGAIQTLALKTGQYGWLGQWYGPGATRANVSGWLKAPVPVMWNIEKK
jgi:peptide/nickel transport system substrate-binding protein